MDPNQCWKDIVDDLRVLNRLPKDRGCRDSVIVELRALAEWLEKGGFAPTI